MEDSSDAEDTPSFIIHNFLWQWWFNPVNSSSAWVYAKQIFQIEPF